MVVVVAMMINCCYPKALLTPKEGSPAIIVKENGRVEVVVKNLYDVPVPPKMCATVKQEFDQLPEEYKVHTARWTLKPCRFLNISLISLLRLCSELHRCLKVLRHRWH